MARSWSIRQPGFGIAAALVAATLLVGGGARAQDAADAPHPAHIHKGTCASLGDIVAPLSNVAPPAGGQKSGPASAIPAEVSVTDVAIPLQTIIDGGHAINVHESAEKIGTYIACGDIGGTVVDNTLVIGLGELNNSGESGIAVLKGSQSGTNVAVYLTSSKAGPAAPAEGTAAAGQAASSAEAVAVSIKNFAFSPNPVEVPVGGTVTWTNDDPVPHTATGRDKSALQSGVIQPGKSFSQKFDTAGSYDYYCEFHANMKGTIVVK